MCVDFVCFVLFSDVKIIRQDNAKMSDPHPFPVGIDCVWLGI